MWDFTNKVAVVTGGGRGIGAGVARAFAQHGARVAVVDIDAEAAEHTCAVIRQPGHDVAAWPCDVRDEDQVETTVNEIVGRFGAIDVLFNNAGIHRRLPLFEYHREDWEAVIGVNLVGVFLVARAVGRHMVARRSGSIVNMSALGGGVVGLGRGSAIYCATKGAVAAMTRDLAAEWAPYGVRVNAVAPGWIKTDMNAPLLQNETAARRVVERVPLARWGEVDDVVGPVLFLASDAARYVTGHLIPIDGGAASIIRLTSDEVIR